MNITLPNGIPMPQGLPHDELLETLFFHEYGYLPKVLDQDVSVDAKFASADESFCGGKAVLKRYELTCNFSGKSYTFPVNYACPKDKTNVPCFVLINFRPDVPDRYLPSDIIADRDFAVISYCYNDVTADNGDFTDGLAGMVFENGERGEHDCGKIGLWAWSMMRVMDFALTLPELDHNRICSLGHSRLGKTSLLAGAMDPRFFCSFSNDSGASGASLARSLKGESVDAICDRFPYWFCEYYQKYRNNESEMPFDQHWLLTANLHHLVYVASAQDDGWADPDGEYYSCVLTEGFVHPDRMPECPEHFHDGAVGYHIRKGGHSLDPEDWELYMDYVLKHGA